MAALLVAVPRLLTPATRTRARPLLRLWGPAGLNSKRWLENTSLPLKERQPGPDSEKFHTIYRLQAIRAFGVLSQLKVAQTALTVLALPPGYYWYSQGLLPLSSLCLAGGIATFALAMLCWMSYFFRRLVGILYVNERGTMLRVAHLNFWGWRQDSYWPVADVVPLTESRDRPQELFVRLKQYSGQQTFYLLLRYGRVLDRERFARVFGNLEQLK